MPLEDDADRGGICLGDNEHTNRMGRRAVAGKRPQRGRVASRMAPATISYRSRPKANVSGTKRTKVG